MDNRAGDPPHAMWVTTPPFSAGDDVQPGLLCAWERDVDDAIWRARVWCLRETRTRVPWS
ncbi:hypothetical protein [Modestobacter sp. Leaf380]|uniref:hypothetical protein n=1 Tax=Modestobacter sp. Leaf380 TaxID=1736356 RepID=UPI0012FBD0D2|nr:hypothetical protein [Modestobacter sp. Leaf380]